MINIITCQVQIIVILLKSTPTSIIIEIVGAKE